MLILRKLIRFIYLFFYFIKKKNRLFKNAIKKKYQLNKLYLKADLLAEQNMTLKYKILKKKKKIYIINLSFNYFFYIFFFFNVL